MSDPGRRDRVSRWWESIDELGGDTEHGARELADRLLGRLATIPDGVVSRGRTRATDWRRELHSRLGHLPAAMSGVEQLLSDLGSARFRDLPTGVAPEVRAWARERRRTATTELRALVRSVGGDFPPTEELVTFSRSSTVRAALTSLGSGQRPGRVNCLESRPGGEGRLLARELVRAGLRGRVVPDREMDDVLDRATFVLIGADSVLPDGSLIHKVGTRRLASRALRAHVPVISLATPTKFARTVPGELGSIPNGFDRTDADRITWYWTPWGPVAPRRATAFVRRTLPLRVRPASGVGRRRRLARGTRRRAASEG